MAAPLAHPAAVFEFFGYGPTAKDLYGLAALGGDFEEPVVYLD